MPRTKTRAVRMAVRKSPGSFHAKEHPAFDHRIARPVDIHDNKLYVAKTGASYRGLVLKTLRQMVHGKIDFK